MFFLLFFVFRKCLAHVLVKLIQTDTHTQRHSWQTVASDININVKAATTTKTKGSSNMQRLIRKHTSSHSHTHTHRETVSLCVCVRAGWLESLAILFCCSAFSGACRSRWLAFPPRRFLVGGERFLRSKQRPVSVFISLLNLILDLRYVRGSHGSCGAPHDAVGAQSTHPSAGGAQ